MNGYKNTLNNKGHLTPLEDVPGAFLPLNTMDKEKQHVVIPNSFQHPNFYIDVLDQYLTPDESKVLTHAIREILGFQNSITDRKKRISFHTFLKGKEVNDKKVYGGVNLSSPKLKKALDSLHHFKILVKTGNHNHPKGQMYGLTEDTTQIEWELLFDRKSTMKVKGQKRMKKARTVQTDRVSNSSDSLNGTVQTDRVSNSSDSLDGTVQTDRSTKDVYSSDSLKERNPELEIQKERQERNPEKMSAETQTPPLPSFFSNHPKNEKQKPKLTPRQELETIPEPYCQKIKDCFNEFCCSVIRDRTEEESNIEILRLINEIYNKAPIDVAGIVDPLQNTTTERINTLNRLNQQQKVIRRSPFRKPQQKELTPEQIEQHLEDIQRQKDELLQAAV